MPNINDMQGFSLFIVKWNKGGVVRFARFTDIIRNLPQQDRLEVEIANLTKEEAKNPNWQANCIIWWKHNSDFWYEATRQDAKAEQEYQNVIKKLKDFPDINPNDSKSSGTLIRSFAMGKQYLVVDGNMRNKIN